MSTILNITLSSNQKYFDGAKGGQMAPHMQHNYLAIFKAALKMIIGRKRIDRKECCRSMVFFHYSVWLQPSSCALRTTAFLFSFQVNYLQSQVNSWYLLSVFVKPAVNSIRSSWVPFKQFRNPLFPFLSPLPVPLALCFFKDKLLLRGFFLKTP